MGKVSAKIEAANELVKQFGTKLNEYNTHMADYISDLYGDVESLGSCWKGISYNNFKKNMTNQLEKLQCSVEEGKKLKYALDKYNEKLTAALEKLKQSGE